jgi:hypothetical protein
MLSEEGANKIVETLTELNVQKIVSIPKLGPFDFSISNAVIYMWVSAVIVFVFFFVVAKRLKKNPDGLQTVAEILLGFATGHLTGQIGEKGKKYYYIILTLFCYIMVTNLIGLIPKPIPLKGYTPTGNINVTFGMAMIVFLITQFQGFKRHGAQRHLLPGALHGRVLQTAFALRATLRQHGGRALDHPGHARAHAAVRECDSDHPGRPVRGDHAHLRGVRRLHPGLYLFPTLSRVHRVGNLRWTLDPKTSPYQGGHENGRWNRR